MLVNNLRKQADMTTKGHARACPQIKEASKRTDVTLKRHVMAIVLKLKKRAHMTMMRLVRA